jgi:hypothetical protein
MGILRRVDPMRPLTDEHRHLAGAFLALADDPEPPPSQRTVPRVVCAFAAGLVIALAAPLAWASPSPRDQPTATAAGKAGAVLGDDDDDAGGGAA